MDFIIRLPHTQGGYDLIWVIVDQLTKVAHFIPVKTTYNGLRLAQLYMERTVCLYGVSKKIVSGRGTQFTSYFWQRANEYCAASIEVKSGVNIWRLPLRSVSEPFPLTFSLLYFASV